MPAMPRGSLLVLIPLFIIVGIYDIITWPFRRAYEYFTGYVSPREVFRKSLIASREDNEEYHNPPH